MEMYEDSETFETKTGNCNQNEKKPCPLSTPAFIVWKKELVNQFASISRRLDEDQKLRHDRNAAIAELIDSERLSRINLEKKVTELADMHIELINALKGNWANPGVIDKIKLLTDKVDHIELSLNTFQESVKLKNSIQKGFITGVAFIGSIIGSIIGIGSTILLGFLNK